MKKKYVEKVVFMKVAEYVEMYNKDHDVKINRMDVYAMIKHGDLKAHKGAKGAWIIELVVKEEVKETKPKKAKKVKEYTVKEWMEAYNKKNNESFSESKVRKLLEKGIIKGEKVDRKWKITTSPSKKITLCGRR